MSNTSSEPDALRWRAGMVELKKDAVAVARKLERRLEHAEIIGRYLWKTHDNGVYFLCASAVVALFLIVVPAVAQNLIITDRKLPPNYTNLKQIVGPAAYRAHKVYFGRFGGLWS